jgi:hypothetical protein
LRAARGKFAAETGEVGFRTAGGVEGDG